MVGQLVADMFMQVFIELARRIAQDIGYAQLISSGGQLLRVIISGWIDRSLYNARNFKTCTSFLNTMRMVFLSN